MIQESNMNTWGYLTLIAALLLLTAYMLYARFAARSREKSLHHAPTESGPVEFEPRVELLTAEESDAGDVAMDLKPCSGESVVEVKDDNEEKEKEKDTYLDDLQEAAAGLAMLMRSSPAQDRSEPVVFAPEAEEAVDELEESEEVVEDAAVEEETVLTIESDDGTAETADDVAEEELSDTASISEAIDQVEAILEEPPVFDEEHSDLTAEPDGAVPGKTSLEALLGEEVSEQFSRLDNGLDELESLVVDIEEQLMRFDEFISSTPEEVVEEAA